MLIHFPMKIVNVLQSIVSFQTTLPIIMVGPVTHITLVPFMLQVLITAGLPTMDGAMDIHTTSTVLLLIKLMLLLSPLPKLQSLTLLLPNK